MKKFTDEQLVKNYLRGDEKSLEKLVQRYLPLIYNFSRRYSGDSDNASDITQEVFVKVWKNLKKPALSLSKGFDSKKGNFRIWLFTIAKNTALDWLKKKNALPLSLLNEYQDGEDLEANIADPNQVLPAEKFYRASLNKNLAIAIAKLPLKYGSVINFYHDKDLNFREIASVLNESINTVKSRYRRGLAMLKNLLLKDNSL